MKSREQWFAVNEIMKIKNIFLTLFTSFFLVSCSGILVRPGFEITKREETNITKEYEVIEKVLTAEEINYQNQSKFPSRVKVYNPTSDSQEIITLAKFSSEILPPDRAAGDYYLGPGDVIKLEILNASSEISTMSPVTQSLKRVSNSG